MSNLRTGSYGNYYGSFYSESVALTREQMSMNAKYIYSALTAAGWSLNAIGAMLGNMQAESSINPGRWQNDTVGSSTLGYGLVQWTPSTKYTEWAAAQGFSDPSEMDANIARITYEVTNNMQWIAKDAYDMTFAEFSVSGLPVAYLAKAFLLCYERPADQSESVQAYRAANAEAWYQELSGTTPEPETPTTTTRKRKKYNFILFNKRRTEQWIR
mgnify:CR=1 FL=1